MASTYNPVYTWRQTGKQDPNKPTLATPATVGQTNYAGAPSQPAPAAASTASTSAAPPPSSTQGTPAPSIGSAAGGFNALGAAGSAAQPKPYQAPTQVPATAPAAPGETKPRSILDQLSQNPYTENLLGGLTQSLQGDLEGKGTGSAIADQLARNNFIKAGNEAYRKALEASSVNGRAATGQIGGDAAHYLQGTLLPQRANFEAQLAGQAQDKANQTKQAAYSSIGNLLGTGAQAEAQKANLGLEQQRLGQQESQFARGLASQEQESQLGRELQKYVADSGLALDAKKLEENVKQFGSRLDFDKSQLAANLDETQKDRIWKSNEADVARKFETGERLSTQEHQTNLARLGGEIDADKMRLQQTLNLDTLDKQQAHDKLMAGLANQYQTVRDQNQFSHEQAMEQLKNNYAQQLQSMGYSHDQALQATQLQAQSIENARNRENESLLAKADLAYKYKALDSETGIKREELDARKKEMESNVSIALQELGLKKEQVNSAIKSQALQDQMGITATMIELAGDDRDAIQFASEKFMGALRDQKVITEPEYEEAIKGIRRGTQTSSGGGGGSFYTDNALKDSASGFANLLKGNFLTGGQQAVSGGLGGIPSMTRDAATLGSKAVRGTTKLIKGLF